MSKRAGQFDRLPRDLYRTWDPRAAQALARFLEPETRFVEPCAGEGDLIDLLEALGHICVAACDIHPLAARVQLGDALRLLRIPPGAELFITNPPWSRPILRAIIAHLMGLAPGWFLFDADWAFGKIDGQPQLLPHCSDIVAVGRLRWIPGTSDDGKDNCAWYRFDARHSSGPRFHGKAA